PGLADISLTTNGMLLEAYARPLYEAGIRRINISLDTQDPRLFREITRGGDMDRFWSGVEACRRLGFEPIKLNMVVLKGVNDGEIADFVALAMAKPYHVRFIEFMPFGAGPYGWEHFVPTRTTMEQVSKCADIKPLASRPYEGPAVRYEVEGAKGTIGFISPVSSHFCHTCNRLRLTADGRLRSCLFSDREINLKAVLRGGDGDAGIERGLTKLFREAVDAKPRAHNLHPGHNCRLCRTMSRIGG
ncbi:MAG: radical SAM protein, partial [bacterium]|nr:radical SAM protein [bacterium]